MDESGIDPTSRLWELADKLGGHGSAIKGGTHSRILRGVAQQTGRGIRRELAQALDISQATVNKAVGEQIREQLIEKQDDRPGTGAVGRPHAPLALARHFASIGIAVITRGGTPVELAGKVTFLDGEPLPGFEKARIHSLGENASTADASEIQRLLAQELPKFAAELSGEYIGSIEILGCGITFSGQVDVKHNSIKRAFHTDWGRSPNALDLAKEIEYRIQRPVFLGNDIFSLAVRNNLRVLPELAPRDYGVIAVVDKGVGGAIVADYKTWSGAKGMAGEPGHIPVIGTRELVERECEEASRTVPHLNAKFETPRCQCGGLGHVEAYASPRAIEERARQYRLVEGRDDVSIGELAARPRSDDDVSSLFREGGAALGHAIVSLTNWFDPEHVLVYLPIELAETNGWLAGSRYREAMIEEIGKNPLIEDAEALLRVNPTTASIMRERLASAAGYLVFRVLLRTIQNMRPPRRTANGD